MSYSVCLGPKKDSGLIWVKVNSETHSRDLTLEFDSVVELNPYLYFKWLNPVDNLAVHPLRETLVHAFFENDFISCHILV